MSKILNSMSGAMNNAIGATAPYRWYASKSKSDQRVLKALACLIVMMILYLGVWQPVSEYAQKQQQRAQQAQTLADWIATNRQALMSQQRAAANSGVSNSDDGQPTIAKITNSAANFGITLSRLQPEADGSVSVSLEQQSFDGLMKWLAGIESEQGYLIDRASIDRGDRNGRVNAQFRFR